VQWHGLPPDDTSWEKWDELRFTYDLEDKVDLEEESNDIDPTVGPSVQGRPKRTITKPGKWKDFVTTNK
jgi:hypothetical protein